jgi:hypothetical protein
MEYQGAISRAWGAFFFWLNAYTFDKDLSEDEINGLIFGKLVLMDYYANCVKPRTPSGLNERTNAICRIRRVSVKIFQCCL